MSICNSLCYNLNSRIRFSRFWSERMKEIYDDKYLQIGLKISYYRKLRGLTQEQLAEKINKTPAFIGHVEAPNIRKAISLDTLFDIADMLEVPAYKFLIFDEQL